MQHSGSNRKTRAHQNKRGKQLTPASICADGGKLVDTSIAAELRLLPEGLTECPALQLPFLLSYELLRESQSFTRILAEKNANEGWCINFLGWDMPGLKSPYSFDRLFEYYPAPWLDLPSYERARFGCETSALPIRGEDLLDLILNTCFRIDIESDERQFPPIGVRGLDEGGANEGMYSMVPKLQYGMEYILMELDPMKSKEDLMNEFKRGLQRHLTEKVVTRGDSIHDRVLKLVSHRLHKAIGGFAAIQELLKLRKLPGFPCTERAFYRNAKDGRMLVEEYDRAVQRSLRALPAPF